MTEFIEEKLRLCILVRSVLDFASKHRKRATLKCQWSGRVARRRDDRINRVALEWSVRD